MTKIILDGLDEEEFRRSIETRLRRGLAGAAIERLRSLLAPYAGPGGILPERFLTVTAADLHFYGWESLGDVLRRHDLPGRPITALSIAFAWPGEDAPAPDSDGLLAPHIEVGFFNDESFPFSQSALDDLLEGYSLHGCTWSGDYVAADTVLALGGIDDLHGALAALEARLLASEEPDEIEIRAGSLASCLLSALLFQAVGEQVARAGLPRPLCVMSGSDGVYPYFDAPVVGMPDDAVKAAEAAANDPGIPGPRYSSLLVTSIPRARKRAVLVLESDEAASAARLAALRGQAPHDPEPPAPDVPGEEPPLPRETPLLAKKPPKPDWDFRDLLTPMGPASAPEAEPEAADECDDWDEPEALPEAPPPSAALAVPVAPPVPETLAGPGFALLDSDPAARLQLLLERQFPLIAPSPAPAPEPAWLEPGNEAPPAPQDNAEPIGMSPAASEPAGPTTRKSRPRPLGRWAQLRGWFDRWARR